MKYEEAIKIVEKEFETRYVDTDCRAIRINMTYDGVNGLHAVICAKGDESLITDEGITKDIFYKSYDEAQWRAMCEENGFSLNGYGHIERTFGSIADIHDFIDFLLLISDKFNPLPNAPL